LLLFLLLRIRLTGENSVFMPRASWTAAYCLLLALAPALANAQARDPAAAEALFRRGREAVEAKRYSDALTWFAESQRLDPAAGTLMNLATCEEKLGRLASAWQHWKEALDALPPNDDRVPLARNRVAALEPKLPRLGVSLASGREGGARVFRDDVELGPASQGVPLPVDAGDHVVTVHMPGRLPGRFAVRLAEGEQKRLEVRPGAVDASVRDANRNATAWPRTTGWVMTGVGVAGVGTAIVSGIMLLDHKSTVEEDCPNKSCVTQDGLDAANAAKTLTTVNTAAWVAGGVGLGLGAYLLFSTAARDKGKTAVVPSVGSEGFAVWCRGSF
jgi:tetratricopeptide (TPR) repeat protein